MARVIFYVDGFNLYYRALRKPELKWLNVQALAEALFPDDELLIVKYFTATIKPSRIDPRKHIRQQVYFRALNTLPKVQLIYGNYVSRRASMPLYDEWAMGTKKLVCVARQDEKGTDVNLATHLIRDAFVGAFDVAAVVTSDSDLAEPFRIVSEELNLPLVLVHPYVADGRRELREPAKKLRSFTGVGIKKVREGLLSSCQFAERLKDRHGEITRPFEWYASDDDVISP